MNGENDSSAVTLVRRARRGDQDAFLALYDLHAPAIYAYLRLILADPDDAELAIQDVFEAALDALPDFERSSLPVRVWLLWLAHDSAGPPKPERHPFAADNGDSLQASIARLRAGEREVLVLQHVLGLSVSEVAVVVGRSPLSVSLMERRALLSLDHLVRSHDGVRPVPPERLGVRMRPRESRVAYGRRWALASR